MNAAKPPFFPTVRPGDHQQMGLLFRDFLLFCKIYARNAEDSVPYEENNLLPTHCSTFTSLALKLSSPEASKHTRFYWERLVAKRR